MAIEFRIDGLLEMTVKNYHTDRRIEKDFEQGVLDNLAQGEYVIGINSRVIYDINDLETPLYRFDLDATDCIEYMFDCATIVN
jgi:hypothetical protein